MTFLIAGSLVFAFFAVAYFSVGRASAAAARDRGRRPAIWGTLGTLLPVALIVLLMLPPVASRPEVLRG